MRNNPIAAILTVFLMISGVGLTSTRYLKYMQTINLPAQVYSVRLKSRRGGGSCGPTALKFTQDN